jgi:nicotinamide mononucleotide transporter
MSWTLFGQSVTLLEAAAFITGLASVWLTKQRHIWNWPVGLVNVACFIVLFHGAKLYADAVLQIGFAVLSVVGWWQWTSAAAQSPDHEVLVTRTRWREIAASLALAGVAVWAGSAALRAWTDSPVPVADTALLVLSLLATWWQALRRLESWLVWIVVDVISVPLYWQRQLPLTAVLYVIFLIICIAGYADWRRVRQQRGETRCGSVAA